MDNRAIVIFNNIQKNIKVDIEIPLDITANDLIIGLNKAYTLGIDTNNLAQCYLSCENPIYLLRGNITLRECGIRNGTTINFVR